MAPPPCWPLFAAGSSFASALAKLLPAALRAQVALLAARVEELQARLAKDSHNSGKPSCSDGLKRKTKSLRKRSGKRPGGQLGHRGETLRLVATPDDVVEHRPPVCTRCQTSLDNASVALRERRQVWDLPPLRRAVCEHQALHLRCPTCQTITAGAFPAAAAGASGLSGGGSICALRTRPAPAR